MPLVSVVIPVYNVEPYLEQCVRSVLNQTLKDIEVICVDDGSTDASMAILHRLAVEDSRLSVLSQRNCGAAVARNRGMQIATGDYLSFLDSDDFFEPDMLEVSYRRALETQADIVLFRENWYRHLDQRFEERSHVVSAANMPDADVFTAREIKGNPFISLCGWAWDKLFSRAYLERVGIKFQELRIYNDMSFTYSAVMLAERLTFVNKVLVHQRIQRKGAITTTIPQHWDCIIKALGSVRKNLLNGGMFSYYEGHFANYALHMLLFTLERSGSSYVVMYDELRSRAFNLLGIVDDPSVYTDKKEYARFREMLATPTLEMAGMRLESQKSSYEGQLRKLKEENARLRQGGTAAVPAKKTAAGPDEAALIRMSASYKIGRFFTWPARKLRTFVRCVNEHGWGYTWNVYVANRAGKGA